ncbi:SDR family oxidoreductase [Hyphobacterium sp. HN65]|uniref:SDR family oxidoreductase n=1 Tax=Hyphobacterium lacteum TaxID=3116575 RepID=A0ABU7LM18_9PROT|nr:SDR family oxidoreductase [Hyphobacterium sp. HN65]MEE2524970.1 SDR family oxidoreductase [Hyphobacterium sp. HN65]
MGHLDGKTAVITGGGTGIGLAIAKRLADDGANCVLMGRNLQRLEDQAKGIARARAVQCDVTDAENVLAAFADARGDGAITVLVNNAGIASSAPFHRMSEEEFLRIQDVNVTGVFRCTRAVTDDMRAADYGRVINISSIAGLSGGPYISHYCASKHAVIGMTRALAAEWAKTNTTVNAICPGYVRTEMAEGAIRTIIEKTGATREQAEAELSKNNPQGRLLEVEEVAEIAGWLCHPNSLGINGQAVALNGGHSM